MIAKLAKRSWNSPVITSWFKLLTMSLRGVLVVPLIVTCLSTQQITVYYLFNSFIAFAPFLTSAITGSYMRGFSFAWKGASSYKLDTEIPEGQGVNEEFFKKIYRSSNLIQTAMGAMVVVILSIVGYLGLREQIYKLNDPNAAWICWTVLVASIFIKVWLNRNAALLKGIGKIANLNKWDIVVALVNVVAICLMLKAGLDLYAIAIKLILANALQMLGQQYMIRCSEVNHLITKRFLPLDRDTFKSIWSASSREMVISLLTVGVARASGIIAAFFILGEELPTYLNAISLMMIALNTSRAPFYAHNPRFAGLRSAHKIKELAIATGKGIRNTLYAFVILACIIALVIPVLFEIIGSNVDFISHRYWLLMAIVALLGRYEAMNSQIIMSSNKVMFVREQIVTGVLKLMLMVVGVKCFGVIGIIVSQGIAGLLIMNWLAPKHAWKSLGSHAALHRKQYQVHAFIVMALLIIIMCWAPYASGFILDQYTLYFK